MFNSLPFFDLCSFLISPYTSGCFGFLHTGHFLLPASWTWPWSVNSLSHSGLVCIKINCFRESFYREKLLITSPIINVLKCLIGLGLGLEKKNTWYVPGTLECFKCSISFHLTSSGLKTLDHLPKVTQINSRE